MPLLLSAALLLALSAQQASPDQADARPPEDQPAAATLIAEPLALVFAGCDLNHDGATTRDELHLCLKGSFDAIAAGAKDIGYIGYGDWATKWMGNPTAVPGPFETDTNNNNRISLNELEARFDSIFDRLDVNKDGKITRAELLTIRSSGNRFSPGDGRKGKGHRRH